MRLSGGHWLRKVKHATGKPVIAVGMLDDPAVADHVLGIRRCDACGDRSWAASRPILGAKCPVSAKPLRRWQRGAVCAQTI